MENQDKYEDLFTQVRYSVAREFPGRSLLKAMIYSIIEGYEKSGMECWVTNEQLSELLGVHKSNVNEAVAQLKQAGYISSKYYTNISAGNRTRKMRIKFRISPTATKRKKK